MEIKEGIPFLYGELNKEVEYLRYNFKSSDGSVSINQNNYDVDFSVNTQTLVTLKRIQLDTSLEDDVIKHYGLFAYNPTTKQYDIQLGETIKVGASSAGGITSVFIAGEEIPFTISETGQLVLEYIPPGAIKDEENPIIWDEINQEWIIKENKLDGNLI